MRRPAIDYVPHRPPMLFLDEVGEETEDSVVCHTTIRPDHVFLEAGVLSPLILFELVAQACGVYVGVRARRMGREPQVGMIVGCREAELLVDEIRVGDELTVRVERLFGQYQVAAFAGTVMRGEELCAQVTISVVDAELALGPEGGEVEA
jgi:predicted hotdog family 3-hydroxylacyl-ACP dehydratase